MLPVSWLVAWARRREFEDASLQRHVDGVSDPLLFTYLSVSAVLVLLAGLMSGLTLGLLSLSKTDLEVSKYLGLMICTCIKGRNTQTRAAIPVKARSNNEESEAFPLPMGNFRLGRSFLSHIIALE